MVKPQRRKFVSNCFSCCKIVTASQHAAKSSAIVVKVRDARGRASTDGVDAGSQAQLRGDAVPKPAARRRSRRNGHLNVERVSEPHQGGFLDRFALRRVGVNGACNVFQARAHFYGQSEP